MVKLFFGMSISFLVVLSSFCTDKVDFDRAFGKEDAYFNTSYKSLFYDVAQYIPSWLGLNPRMIYQLNSFCRMLYNKHYVKVPLRAHTERIPKLIHQIWLGSPLPNKYKKWQSTWQNMGPDWQYKLWTDADVKELKLFNQNFYDSETNWGAKSDILRIEILYKYGGIYVDTDFECVDPDLFRVFNSNFDFYAGFHPADIKLFALENALIASVPKHPILKGYIQELKNNYSIYNNLLSRTGPGALTRIFFQYANGPGYKDIVFPPSFFYSLGYYYAKECFKVGMTNEEIKKQCLKPESMAVHWWEGSWN